MTKKKMLKTFNYHSIYSSNGKRFLKKKKKSTLNQWLSKYKIKRVEQNTIFVSKLLLLTIIASILLRKKIKTLNNK